MLDYNTKIVLVSQFFGFLGAIFSLVWYLYNMQKERRDVIADKAYKETYIIFYKNLDAFKFFKAFHEHPMD